MAFVKWGVELSPTEPVKATLSFNGLPIREYKDMVNDQKRLVGLVGRMLSCLDEERDAAVMQEAHALLARIKGE